MNTWDDEHDAALAALVRDAVADVQPADGLAAVRARTAARPRRWLLPTAGAVLATAAAVTVVAVVAGQDEPAAGPGPAATPTAPTSVATTPAPSTPAPSTTEPAPAPVTQVVPVYYLGETPQGLRLFREPHPVDAGDPLSAALDLAVSTAPDDPDYAMPWTDGVHASGSWDGDTITIDLTSPQTQDAGTGLHDASPGMTQEQASLAVQQLVYTAMAAVGEGRPPVRILLDGQITDTVLGVPTSEPLAADPELDTLALVSLDTPAEGERVARGDALEVRGRASSFEATVPWKLQRWEGTAVVASGFFTAAGTGPDRLYPFSGEIDLTGVPAGRYLLVVLTDDASGEGTQTFDTRMITVD